MRSARFFPDTRMVWRWHFCAGLFCVPFVLWLAGTGTIYLFKPQIEAWMDRPYEALLRPRQAPASAEAQVSAALSAVPGSALSCYECPRMRRGAPGSGPSMDRRTHDRTLVRRVCRLRSCRVQIPAGALTGPAIPVRLTVGPNESPGQVTVAIQSGRRTAE